MRNKEILSGAGVYECTIICALANYLFCYEIEIRFYVGINGCTDPTPPQFPLGEGCGGKELSTCRDLFPKTFFNVN